MSTFRVDFVAHLATAVNAYIAANPTIVRQYWRRRPGSFAEKPAAFMDSLTEVTQVLDNGTYQRDITTGVVVVDNYADNEQTGARFDIAADGLLSWLIRATYATVGGGYMNITGIDDFDLEQPASRKGELPVNYRAARIGISAHVQEGRPS